MADLGVPPPGESNSGRVLTGFLAMSGSSFGVMGIQLLYAAITSRLLPPSAFGAYAVALSGVGLIGMLGGSSLGQSAARRDHDSVQLDRSLVTLSVIVGCSTALVALLLAHLWGQLWGVPDSAQVTRVLALGVPLAALSAVLAGILRRGGRTSAVAGRTALGQLVGMAIGLAVVLSTRTSWSLSVASVAGLAISAALLAGALPLERLKPTRPTSSSIEDVTYGVKSAGMNLLRYGTTIAPSWSIGRFVGAATLGNYNRSTTLLTVPLENLQRSFSYSLFPELRPGGPVARSSEAFTDLMILVIWAAVTIGGLGFFAAAPFLDLLLGPRWEDIGKLAGIAWLLGVVPIVGVPLGSIIEARGHFRIAGAAWALGAVSVALGIAVTWRLESPVPAMVGLLGYALALALVHLLGALHLGFLEGGRLGRGVLPIVAIQFGVTLVFVGWAAIAGPQSSLASLVAVLIVAKIELGALWLLRYWTPVGAIGASRGLPGFGSRSHP